MRIKSKANSHLINICSVIKLPIPASYFGVCGLRREENDKNLTLYAFFFSYLVNTTFVRTKIRQIFCRFSLNSLMVLISILMGGGKREENAGNSEKSIRLI